MAAEVLAPGRLAAAPGIHLRDTRFQLRPGDTLLLYTDGVTEARRARGTGAPRPLFGEEQLHQVLASCVGLDSQATLDRISATVHRHTAGQTSDDTALLALHVPASVPLSR